MAPHDVVILGSGFGGAVMAARLGAQLRGGDPAVGRVLVIEKGDDPTGAFDPNSDGEALNAQGNRFRQTLAPSYVTRVADLYTDPDGTFRRGVPSMNVVAGRGIGGGSNVYDAVSLRAPTEAFEQARDGRRLWPSIYSRAKLAPHYARVEQTLRVARVAWTDESAPHWRLATKRDYVFAEGCRRIGVTASPLKLADADDANEGWWNQGQRFEGRQGLSKNYLAEARDAGVTFWSGCEVDSIAPSAGGYVVSGIDRRGGVEARFDVECRLLVVACGAVASTGLLLRSRDSFAGERSLDPSGALGKYVSSNGDYGVTGSVGPTFEYDVEGHKGKPMASFCPSYWPSHQFILIPFYAAPLYLSLGQPSTLLRAHDPLSFRRGEATIARDDTGAIERDWGLAYKQRLKHFGSRMLTMGCLALDECEGEVRLSARGNHYDVVWPQTRPSTELRWAAAFEAMRRIYDALGGEMFLDSYRKDGTINTAHPLGGCRMTERNDETRGVVDPNGEVFNNRNLFVVDSAIIPSALGANPSLTIAAVAESIAARLIAGDTTEPLAARLA